MKTVMNWVNCEEELPAEDGLYEVTNHPELEEDPLKREYTATAYYDGWGWNVLGIYRNPGYWRNYTIAEKRYGKIR